MIKPRLILCNGAKLPQGSDMLKSRQLIEMSAHGSDPNVTIRLEDVTKTFGKHLTPRLIDLLEIATYVFSVDCATRRGNDWTDSHSVEAWDRDVHFVLPVRDLAFWSDTKVRQTLIDTLNFLSDDRYTFDFCQFEDTEPKQLYFEMGDLEDWPFLGVDRVLMFSGGLDSLAGAVEMAANGKNLALVSHRSVTTINKRLRDLVGDLRVQFPVNLLHIPVWINKQKGFDREPTQRTRSFLFATLGTVVGQALNAGGVRFFENGVVSLNFPVADEVLRARASRTTHPWALQLMTDFFSHVTERPFVIDNPYLYKTKSDVVTLIASNGASNLIQRTRSCAHNIFTSKNQWHCGTCSQCIDRRIAILAAKQAAFDPDYDYVVDVFTGPRKAGYETNMAVDYARHASELYRMTDMDLNERFNRELTKAVRSAPRRREAAECLIDLHKRHATRVMDVIRKQMRVNVDHLLAGQLPNSSMLAQLAGQQHLKSSWLRFADRVAGLLLAGIPVACKTHKPENEPHLQEICDGILQGQDPALTREFPFMRWSSSLTKPDWSLEAFELWIEMKYVRQRRDIREITEDISSDITKYGDNNRHVLFVVYDPGHLVTDTKSFSQQIVARESMGVQFIH